MRIISTFRIAAACAVFFSVGCEEDDPDPPATPPYDASTGGMDSGAAHDASTVLDTGNAGDGSTAADSAAPADGGGGGGDASANDAGANDGGGMDAAAELLTSGSGPWTVFLEPYGDAGGANPAMNIQGGASARRAGDGGMQVTLNVSGLPPTRGFGSHLHKLTCAMMSAGGHYQHDVSSAPDASPSDPAYANPSNELWLDFTTDDAGAAMISATVGWIPRDGGANAIVVHDRLTGDGGIAGPKLACLPFPF